LGGCLGSGAGGVIGVTLGVGAALTWLDTQKIGTPWDLLGLLIQAPLILALGAGLGGGLGSGCGALLVHAAATKSNNRAQRFSARQLTQPEVTTDEDIEAEISRLNSRIVALESLKTKSTASNTHAFECNEEMVSARQPTSSPTLEEEVSNLDVARSRSAETEHARELVASSDEYCSDCGTKLFQSMEFGRVVTKCANCS
jgi:hypothetical protein